MNRARSALGLLGTRSAYVVLGLGVVALLVAGSLHSGPPTNAQRIAYLDSIIKCPDANCSDLTIGQSDTFLATGLRTQVAAMVAAGASDATIEQYAVANYGESAISSPRRGRVASPGSSRSLAAVAAAGALVATLVRRRSRGRLTVDEVVTDKGRDLVTAALDERRAAR